MLFLRAGGIRAFAYMRAEENFRPIEIIKLPIFFRARKSRRRGRKRAVQSGGQCAAISGICETAAAAGGRIARAKTFFIGTVTFEEICRLRRRKSPLGNGRRAEKINSEVGTIFIPLFFFLNLDIFRNVCHKC